MEYETILYEAGEGVGTITLNRPDSLNSVNGALGKELLAALKAAERDAEVRCLVLRGAGRAFCAGQDLRERQATTATVDARSSGAATNSLGDSLRERYNPIILRLRGMEKPVVAAVNGAAAGAGMSLALACDLVVAASDAQFIEVFARVGLVPDSGSTYFLPRLVGRARAFELMALTEPLRADDALRLGVVNRVVPPEDLRSTAHDLALRLAQGPTKALGLMKRALNRATEADLADALEYEAHLQEIASRTHDHREGVAAFIEKRTAHFEGR